MWQCCQFVPANTLSNNSNTVVSCLLQVQNLERVRAEQLQWKSLVTYRTVQWRTCTLHMILHKKGGSRLVIPVLEQLSGRICIMSERDRGTLNGISAVRGAVIIPSRVVRLTLQELPPPKLFGPRQLQSFGLLKP